RLSLRACTGSDGGFMEVAELKSVVERGLSDVSAEVKTRFSESDSRLQAIEDKLSKGIGGGAQPETKSLGTIVVESEEFKDFISRGRDRSGRIAIPGGFHKTAIINAT